MQETRNTPRGRRIFFAEAFRAVRQDKSLYIGQENSSCVLNEDNHQVADFQQHRLVHEEYDDHPLSGWCFLTDGDLIISLRGLAGGNSPKSRN